MNVNSRLIALIMMFVSSLSILIGQVAHISPLVGLGLVGILIAVAFFRGFTRDSSGIRRFEASQRPRNSGVGRFVRVGLLVSVIGAAGSFGGLVMAGPHNNIAIVFLYLFVAFCMLVMVAGGAIFFL